MKLKSSREIFQNTQNIKFHENPSSGNRVLPFGRTDGQADMTKLIAVFFKFCECP